MVLKSTTLQDFRNYTQKQFEFALGLNLVAGRNATGKSNLLEALYLLATGTSRRADLGEEMIRYKQDLARVKGQIIPSESSEFSELEVILTRGLLLGEKVAKKKFLINGVAKRRLDFVGSFKAVYFGPENLAIIIDGPSIRRDYLDLVLTQTDHDYTRALLSYHKGLRQRNRLLEQIRDQHRPRTSLYFWDRLLIENGRILTEKRAEMVDFVNQNSEKYGYLSLLYQRNLISVERLTQYQAAETAAAKTLIGPHRDDFEIGTRDMKHETHQFDGQARNLHLYGSRGEQRTAIFYLKLAELDFIRQKTEQTPVLLLDDIFSELDQSHRELILHSLPDLQVVLTTTDVNLVKAKYQSQAKIISLG
ncbi:MAG: DNA replication and repair protein RecF [Candidatus Shapirobacteria bacterium]